MKLEVLRMDGKSEVLNVVGSCEFHEPRANEDGSDVGQGCIYCPAIGMRYFFSADGRYDGWEAEVAIPMGDPNGAIPPDVVDFVRKIEEGRDVRERE